MKRQAINFGVAFLVLSAIVAGTMAAPAQNQDLGGKQIYSLRKK